MNKASRFAKFSCPSRQRQPPHRDFLHLLDTFVALSPGMKQGFVAFFFTVRSDIAADGNATRLLRIKSAIGSPIEDPALAATKGATAPSTPGRASR
jgi:hypothetical protein